MFCPVSISSGGGACIKTPTKHSGRLQHKKRALFWQMGKEEKPPEGSTVLCCWVFGTVWEKKSRHRKTQCTSGSREVVSYLDNDWCWEDDSDVGLPHCRRFTRPQETPHKRRDKRGVWDLWNSQWVGMALAFKAADQASHVDASFSIWCPSCSTHLTRPAHLIKLLASLITVTHCFSST